MLVQNTRAEGSGRLGELLRGDGFDVRSVHAKTERIPDSGHSLAVILGAPESANGRAGYLQSEQRLIRKSVSDGIPVLGICLGSQLIAKAFGADVYRGPRKEIGFYSDLEAIPGSRLFSGFENPFTVFHWHGDTFDLPEGAVRLARSGQYQNQAFRIGSAVGLQFHLEADGRMVNAWLDRTEDALRRIPDADPERIRSEIGEKTPAVMANMEKFYGNFKAEFGL